MSAVPPADEPSRLSVTHGDDPRMLPGHGASATELPDAGLGAVAVTAPSRGHTAWQYLFVRHRHNWVQLIKYSLVGASGFVVNLVMYGETLRWVDGRYDYMAAGVFAFVVANTTNYLLNRKFTFTHDVEDRSFEYYRFLSVGLLALAFNLMLLHLLISWFGMTSDTEKVIAQAIAIVLVTPVGFVGNKLWTFGRG